MKFSNELKKKIELKNVEKMIEQLLDFEHWKPIADALNDFTFVTTLFSFGILNFVEYI